MQLITAELYFFYDCNYDYHFSHNLAALVLLIDGEKKAWMSEPASAVQPSGITVCRRRSFGVQDDITAAEPVTPSCSRHVMGL